MNFSKVNIPNVPCTHPPPPPPILFPRLLLCSQRIQFAYFLFGKEENLCFLLSAHSEEQKRKSKLSMPSSSFKKSTNKLSHSGCLGKEGTRMALLMEWSLCRRKHHKWERCWPISNACLFLFTYFHPFIFNLSLND